MGQSEVHEKWHLLLKAYDIRSELMAWRCVGGSHLPLFYSMNETPPHAQNIPTRACIMWSTLMLHKFIHYFHFLFFNQITKEVNQPSGSKIKIFPFQLLSQFLFIYFWIKVKWGSIWCIAFVHGKTSLQVLKATKVLLKKAYLEPFRGYFKKR